MVAEHAAPHEDVLVADVIAEAGRRLHARGERLTGPRRAVLAALARTPGHASAEELVAAVSGSDLGVHRASVYRALESLCQLGLVQHLHLGHGSTAYHLIVGSGRHPHAHCRVCGRVLDLPDDLLDTVAGRLLSDLDFVLEADHLALSGRCNSCAGDH